MDARAQHILAQNVEAQQIWVFPKIGTIFLLQMREWLIQKGLDANSMKPQQRQ
jgi:hypothetical protein